jgi:hypothetical protein
VNRQYYFASLFVRTAKSLAVLIAFLGIGFCVLRYSQANVAAGAVAYRPSPQLEQTLDKLKDSFLSAQQIVDSFNQQNEATTPAFEPPHFPLVIDSNEDFNQLASEIARLDQVRAQLKDSIVSHFEERVKSIEEKLHAYAAVLQSLPAATPSQTQSPISNAIASAAVVPREQSLFSSQVDALESSDRRSDLNERRDFLKALATKAENADNRATLNEAADQLDRLAKLLPMKFDAASAAEPESPAQGPGPEPADNNLLSERVAHQLEQVRGAVRQMLLTSWTLDDSVEQTAKLNVSERERYRIATLAEQGIWLSAWSRIVIALLATGLVSLFILVFADLVRTQLDTATNSGTVADAVNALRGSVVPAGTPSPAPAASPFIVEQKPGIEQDETSVAGGS